MSAKQKLIGYTCGLCILIPCVINNVRHVPSEYLTGHELTFDPWQITLAYMTMPTPEYKSRKKHHHTIDLSRINMCIKTSKR